MQKLMATGIHPQSGFDAVVTDIPCPCADQHTKKNGSAEMLRKLDDGTLWCPVHGIATTREP